MTLLFSKTECLEATESLSFPQPPYQRQINYYSSLLTASSTQAKDDILHSSATKRFSFQLKCTTIVGSREPASDLAACVI